MCDIVEPLILDLLAWLGQGDRDYIETMDAWRTSCPRLPVWESANDQGLVTRAFENGCAVIRVTPKGRELLRRRTCQRRDR
jgi:D-3-phosphoglycerate dehydrogenase